MPARKLATVMLVAMLVLAGTTACKKAEPATELLATPAVDSDVTTTSDEPAPTAEELAAAEGVQDIFANGDDMPVTAGAEGPTFPLVEPMKLTALVTLHVGEVVPGGTIALKDVNGKSWGPWTAESHVAPDGNTFWSCTPNVALPAGEYTVIDSDPATWAKNDGSDGFGFVTAQGVVE